MIYNYIYFRRENKPFLDATLSDESKRKRNRTTRINIQMTVLSWSLEFILGCAIVVDYFFFGMSQSNDYKWFLFPNIFLCSVVIPSSYVLKTEEIKKIVMKKGWWKFGRGFLPVRNSRVVPIEG